MTDNALCVVHSRYNTLMNKIIWISGVTMSTRAKALVLTVTPLMHIDLFISALYLGMHSMRALSYTSYTSRTLRACCSQSELTILKIRESSVRALFLYNCTPNT